MRNKMLAVAIMAFCIVTTIAVFPIAALIEYRSQQNV